MICGSVCSGVGAPEVAWQDLGWRFAFASEIDKFPRAVYTRHHPSVPLHGDFTTIEAGDYEKIDLLVGGTPCQSFSVAGARAGMADDRGNLAIEFLKLAERTRPRWLVWENVPGVLSSNEGRDFGAVLGGMARFGYGTAYRILDAQNWGVPQQRRRVFVIGYLGNWQCAAAVLFQRNILSRNNPSRKKKKKDFAAGSYVGNAESNKLRTDNKRLIIETPDISKCLKSRQQTHDPATETWVVYRENDDIISWNNELTAYKNITAPLLGAGQKNDSGGILKQNGVLRRFTPLECERLQGFPDNYTQIEWRGKPAEDCPVGLRGKAMGNSMAVPVMRWIGERIQQVDEIAAIRSSQTS